MKNLLFRSPWLITLGASLPLFTGAATADAAAFTPGNVVVVRFGDGAAALSSAAAPAFLDEYSPGGVLVQTLALPTTVAGSNARLVVSGSATSEGFVNRSVDGQFLSLTGYDAAPGTAAIAGTTSASANRIVGRVDAAGTVDTSTRLFDGYSTGNIRSAATDDGSRFWTSGSTGGVRFVPFANGAGVATTQVATTPANDRVINIFGGQLYVDSGSANFLTVSKVGAGLPTNSGNAVTPLPGLPATGAQPYGFVLLDRDATVPGPDTLYVADQTAGLQKFSFDGTNWTARGTVARAGLTGLTAVVNGASVDLYAVVPGNLARLTDTAAFNVTLTGTFTAVATASSNTAFRGVAFAPVGSAASTAPTGTGLAQPNTVAVGQTTLLTVAVVPAANPASTGLGVTGDLTGIGGTAAQMFYDNGTNGDAVAGDNTFSFLATVAAGSGAVSLPATIRDAQNRTGSTSIALTVDAPAPITFIHTIQGTAETPQTGRFRVEGIVTAAFPNLNPAGFYVQEEDADADNDPATSEGIFVQGTSFPAVGQKVQVQGTVANTNGLTQFTAGATVEVQAGGAIFPLPTAVTPPLPAAAASNGTPYLERFEGMRVTFPAPLYVTDNYDVGLYGEVGLAVNKQVFIPTNHVDPNDDPAVGNTSTGTGNVAAVLAEEDLNNRSRFVLDDGSDSSHPAPIPFLRAGGPGGGRTLRVGDSVRGLTGILNYGFGSYRVQATAPVTFDATNPRPSGPEAVGGNVRVAESNVLNYFNTFGGPNDRGADSTAELTRQRAKLVNVLSALDADIIGFTELENNGTGAGSAVDDLLNSPNGGLNTVLAAAGRPTYSIIPTPATPFGTDAIQVGLAYRSASVLPVGAAVTDNANFSTYNRPPLAQLFTISATGGQFYVCINHFKSKGAGGATGADLDQGDGQSAYNARRKAQSTALLSFLGGLAVNDPDILVVGDLNAYGEEDPIDILRAGGYVDLIGSFARSEPYSYQFNGEQGRLDHALSTRPLAKQTTGAIEYHVNADEPTIIDYNLDTNDQTNPPPKGTNDEYVANGYRASDHDPLLVGFNLTASPLTLSPSAGRVGTSVVIDGPNLAGATAVTFGGNVSAAFTGNSASEITATVPVGAITGPVRVTRANGTVVNGPVFFLTPRIGGFSPASAPVGAAVILTGSGFTGATAVRFNSGVAAAYQVDSDTQITATVPAGAMRGTLRVETAGGAATSLNKFSVIP